MADLPGGRLLAAAGPQSAPSHVVTTQDSPRGEDPLWNVLGDSVVPAALVDSHGLVTHANPALAALIAAPVEDIIGVHWSQFTDLADLPDAGEMFRRAVSGEVRQYSVQRRWVRKDGLQITVDVQVVRRADTEGGPGLLVLAVDRTANDRADAVAGQRFREAFENSPIGMAVLDADRRIIDANEAHAQIAAVPREQLIGRRVDDFIDPADLPASYDDTDRLLRGEPGYHSLRHGWRGNGEEAWLLVSATALRDERGEPALVLLQLVDLTSTVRAERELETHVAQLGALSELGRLALTDASQQEIDEVALRAVLEVLPAAGCGVLEGHGADADLAAWVGAGRGAFTAQHLHAADPLVKAANEPGVTFLERRQEVWQRARTAGTDSSPRDAVAAVVAGHQVSVAVVALLPTERSDRNGHEFLVNIAHVLAATRHRAATAERLRRLATQDPLTGLANRRLLAEQLGLAIARARRDAHPTVLFLVDLDDFKTVNDTHGHDTGDLVLQEVADRLRRAVRSFDLVVRLGGDEFVIVAESVDEHELASLEGRIQRLVAAPVDAPTREELRVTATVAHVLTRGDDTPADLMRLVDERLYRNKDTRG